MEIFHGCPDLCCYEPLEAIVDFVAFISSGIAAMPEEGRRYCPLPEFSQQSASLRSCSTIFYIDLPNSISIPASEHPSSVESAVASDKPGSNYYVAKNRLFILFQTMFILLCIIINSNGKGGDAHRNFGKEKAPSLGCTRRAGSGCAACCSRVPAVGVRICLCCCVRKVCGSLPTSTFASM